MLVPLCGKSLDLAWLAGQGFNVLGVELSEKAVEAFFAEQQLEAEVSQAGAFRVYRSGAWRFVAAISSSLAPPMSRPARASTTARL
ncbi:thiopurine s-methyltransferase [Pseudomonas sp. BAY1663]|nr:thiopurine s-methyltransferase [Pseudomonas sp. BAY1663]